MCELAHKQSNVVVGLYGERRNIDGRSVPVARAMRRVDQAGRRDFEVSGDGGMAYAWLMHGL